MAEKTKLGSRGKKHVSDMMERFHKGRLLRTSSGEKLHPGNPKDESKAAAIAYSEAKAGEERGFTKRTWKGSTRTRPKLSKK
jgi:hypothetical protein